MTKTRNDVVTQALRRLGVAAIDVAPSAEDNQHGVDVYDALIDELNSKEGFTDLSDANAVPDWAYLPLAQMLAVELAPQYGTDPKRVQWFEGMKRLRRHAFPDDRTDPADIDNDTTVSAAEAQDDLEAQFF